MPYPHQISQRDGDTGPMPNPTSAPLRVAILLFDDMDLLDMGGPYEVLLTANRLLGRDGDPPAFDVTTVGVADSPVTAYGGVRLLPQTTAAESGGADIVVVPGAIDIEAACADPQVAAAVRGLVGGAQIATSVCTGAFLLADAGLLGGKPWTTHWEDIPALQHRLGAAAGGAVAGQAREARWVDSGTVVTAGGLSCGIDMALHLVDRLVGRELAARCARQLDYPWDPQD